jgi:hypothetical protein
VENNPAWPPPPAAHEARGGIVHDSAKHVLIFVVLRGRDFWAPRGGRQVARVQHLQGRENMAVTILVEGLAGDALDERAEGDEVDVTVGEFRSRRIDQGFGERHAVGGFLAFPFRFAVEIRLQTGVMREQLAHRDVFFFVVREVGQILCDRIVQPDFATLD